MATVYKIEVEAVSYWVNFPSEEMLKRIKEAIQKEFEKESHNEFEISNITVVRKS
jgi:hypothetical protein